MARHGALRAWADQLGLGDAARLLEQTLSEEKATDAKLSVLALGGINTDAENGTQRSKMPTARAGAASVTRPVLEIRATPKLTAVGR